MYAGRYILGHVLELVMGIQVMFWKESLSQNLIKPLMYALHGLINSPILRLRSIELDTYYHIHIYPAPEVLQSQCMILTESLRDYLN